MAKSKPIGVRFDEDMLETLKKEGKADSPQKVLNYLTNLWKNLKEPWKYFEHGRPFGGKEPKKPVQTTVILTGTQIPPRPKGVGQDLIDWVEKYGDDKNSKL
jgi:hypothetical protein